jgi:hypothetical protein
MIWACVSIACVSWLLGSFKRRSHNGRGTCSFGGGCDSKSRGKAGPPVRRLSESINLSVKTPRPPRCLTRSMPDSKWQRTANLTNESSLESGRIEGFSIIISKLISDNQCARHPHVQLKPEENDRLNSGAQTVDLKGRKCCSAREIPQGQLGLRKL